MGKTNAQTLDAASPIHNKFKTGSHLQALEDGYNTTLIYLQMPKLLAQLDADVLTASNYAATQTPLLIPGDVRTKFNALLAALDSDVIVGDTTYASLLTAGTDADLPTQWAALLAKLDADGPVPDNTYVAKNTLPFLRTTNQEKSF